MSQTEMLQLSNAELQALATKILRKAGFTWSGRAKDSIDPKQCSYERLLTNIKVPQGGMTRKWNHNR